MRKRRPASRSSWRGDTALDDFRANSVSLTQSPGFDRNTNQLLSWKTLSLRGLQVAMAPGAPLSVDVKETALTDLFARVIVDATGRLNLQSLTKKGEQESAAKAQAAADPTSKRSLGGTTTTTANANAAAAAAPAATASAPVAAAGTAADGVLAPVMNFGPMSLVNAKIDFTDLFVKPNYSADLSELTGKLSAFSSKPAPGADGKIALADLELRGKAQQTALLEITGKLNPLVKPLELDITARMRDLDLAPLSPYAVRYAGHGIERGKMSMDVNYKIAPDGQLTATNKLVLNQLQFGEEVKGAPASLPVRLAVALLADRNGVIDVDLPLRGSLNDPQFSIGPLILKVIGNLIVKAVTAPFSLLTGGLGGGSGESSAIVFEPGASELSASAKESLDKVAKALTDRPALQMTVVGTSNLEKEKAAYQKQRVRQMAQAEKRRIAARAGNDAAAGGSRHRCGISRIAHRRLQARRHHQAAQRRGPGQGPAAAGNGRPPHHQRSGRRGSHAATRGRAGCRGARLPPCTEALERAPFPRRGAHRYAECRLEAGRGAQTRHPLRQGLSGFVPADAKSVKISVCAGPYFQVRRRLRFLYPTRQRSFAQ